MDDAARRAGMERMPLLFIVGAVLCTLRDDKTQGGQVQSRLLPPYSLERCNLFRSGAILPRDAKKIHCGRHVTDVYSCTCGSIKCFLGFLAFLIHYSKSL